MTLVVDILCHDQTLLKYQASSVYRFEL